SKSYCSLRETETLSDRYKRGKFRKFDTRHCSTIPNTPFNLFVIIKLTLCAQVYALAPGSCRGAKYGRGAKMNSISTRASFERRPGTKPIFSRVFEWVVTKDGSTWRNLETASTGGPPLSSFNPDMAAIKILHWGVLMPAARPSKNSLPKTLPHDHS